MFRSSVRSLAPLLLALAIGCGGGGGGGGNAGDGGSPTDPTPPPTGGNPSSGVVDIHLTAGNQFEPANVSITPGTTVRWISDTAVGHTITPNDTGKPGVWARQVVSQSGVALEHTFGEAGQTYNYFCEPHQSAGMEGSIRVTQ